MKPVFVFGSNKAGRHGKGAAKDAMQFYGAVYGQGEGYQGNAYAIPTKDGHLRTLPIADVRKGVERFVAFAASRPDLEFNVTRVGCGLAGLTDAAVAPMFRDAPANCRLPEGWRALGSRTDR